MSHKVPVKKPFLRKGEGIARFGMKQKKRPLQRARETVEDNKTIPNTRTDDMDQTVQSSTNGPVSRPTQINHQLVPTKVCLPIVVCVVHSVCEYIFSIYKTISYC